MYNNNGIYNVPKHMHIKFSRPYVRWSEANNNKISSLNRIKTYNKILRKQYKMSSYALIYIEINTTITYIRQELLQKTKFLFSSHVQ